jgi:hypothetical protein
MRAPTWRAPRTTRPNDPAVPRPQGPYASTSRSACLARWAEVGHDLTRPAAHSVRCRTGDLAGLLSWRGLWTFPLPTGRSLVAADQMAASRSRSLMIRLRCVTRSIKGRARCWSSRWWSGKRSSVESLMDNSACQFRSPWTEGRAATGAGLRSGNCSAGLQLAGAA